MPGERSVIRYRPEPSVTPLRAFSINAVLLASTVTPGNTPPEASRTTPANVACACAVAGRTRNPRSNNARDPDLIEHPFHHELRRPEPILPNWLPATVT